MGKWTPSWPAVFLPAEQGLCPQGALCLGGHIDLDLSLQYEVGRSWYMPGRDPSAIFYHPWSQSPVPSVVPGAQ